MWLLRSINDIHLVILMFIYGRDEWVREQMFLLWKKWYDSFGDEWSEMMRGRKERSLYSKKWWDEEAYVLRCVCVHNSMNNVLMRKVWWWKCSHAWILINMWHYYYRHTQWVRKWRKDNALIYQFIMSIFRRWRTNHVHAHVRALHYMFII